MDSVPHEYSDRPSNEPAKKCNKKSIESIDILQTCTHHRPISMVMSTESFPFTRSGQSWRGDSSLTKYNNERNPMDRTRHLPSSSSSSSSMTELNRILILQMPVRVPCRMSNIPHSLILCDNFCVGLWNSAALLLGTTTSGRNIDQIRSVGDEGATIINAIKYSHACSTFGVARHHPPPPPPPPPRWSRKFKFKIFGTITHTGDNKRESEKGI